MEEKKVELKISSREYELLLFIRNKLPYGKCLLVTHEGQPSRVEEIQKSEVFGKEKTNMLIVE